MFIFRNLIMTITYGSPATDTDLAYYWFLEQMHIYQKRLRYAKFIYQANY